MKNYLVSILVFIIIGSFNTMAKENVPNPNDNDNDNYRIIASGCLAASAQTELNINNVRTTILAGGDMWWNLDTGKYEIPKESDKHSMFAGALWIGGMDDQGNLKVAGMTYRQDGNDFWPGPLNGDVASDDYGTITPEVCSEFDKHFVITEAEVVEYVAYNDCVADPNCDAATSYPDGYSPPLVISEWPASRLSIDGTFDYLAPFEDVNGDGMYTVGTDYPAYDLDGVKDCKSDDLLFGDQTLWWVFNDNGNIHTETGSESAIGLEIQAQAFGFQTNDEINNMTFYSYKIINRSTSVLNQAYFGQWVDPDLGNYQDDYVGCDVGLGLGYCYNGDQDDDGTAGYNYDSDDPPPAIGVDFFRGPLADIGDGIDNDKDGVIDEPGEQIIMSKFVYYNNDFSDFGNPENASHYYGYLRGIWKNGQPMTYGGTGWESSNPECNFMFPDDTDPEFYALQGPWTEITAGNDPADRRFLQSAGPFTLEPGAVNYITTGVVWARASEGDNFASVELMKIADTKAQTLFDICFEVIDGPSAPDITYVELDQAIIMNLTNSESSNNYANQYVEMDPFISDVLADPDGDGTYENIPISKDYVFEGYQVFQLKDASVTSSDLYNPDKAYMIYQCDIENYRTLDGQVVSVPTEESTPIANLVNYTPAENIGPGVYLPKNMTLSAANSGINNSIMITEDKFASGNPSLINNKPYYYMAIAYAYNEYIPYAPEIPFTGLNPYVASNLGQKKPYLAGRKNIKTYTIIPHKTESFGDRPTASYGTTPSQGAIAGRGNGGNFVELYPDARLEIAIGCEAAFNSDNCDESTIAYRKNASPLKITVVDPLSVPDADFIFKVTEVEAEETEHMDDYASSGSSVFHADPDSVITNARWTLTKIENGDTVTVESQNSLTDNAQQIITEWGLGVTFKSIPSLESGLLDYLGCLTCAGWFSITNGELTEMIWGEDGWMDGADGVNAGNISDITTNQVYIDAVNDLWLSNTPDIDDVWQFVPFTRPLDWVRSGTNYFAENSEPDAPFHYYGDISVNGTPLDQTGSTNQQIPLDPDGAHENQWLVPYKLVSVDYKGRKGASSTTNVINFIDTIGGGLAWKDWKNYSSLDHLNNVDVVLTPDTSLWTRCPVLDMSEESLEWVGPIDANPVDQSNGTVWPYNTASGNNYPWDVVGPTGLNQMDASGDLAGKWDLRLHPNVNKEGEPDGTGLGFNSENGWGWFPGYAVDVSRGIRLNLMFSENSSLQIDSLEYSDYHESPKNMIYDPMPFIFDVGVDGLENVNPVTASAVTMNGGHAVYVLDTEYQGSNQEDNPHYAEYVGTSANTAWNSGRKRKVIPHIMWVGNWYPNTDKDWLSEELVIRARVQEGYGYRHSSYASGGYTETDPTGNTLIVEDTLLNNGYPWYQFNTSEILTNLDDQKTKEEGLEEVNIVPNPYYGTSGYETGQVDNRVKITNLPKTCTISIYAINGNLIKQVKKDNEISYFEWDLKNNYGIPIASGMYIIHIDADGIGEKVLKWFGALRPTDLDNF